MLARFRKRAFVALTIPTLLSSCHSYVPVSSAPAKGMRVSAELTDLGTVELARYVGPGVEAIEGRLVQSSDSAVLLSVFKVRKRNGIEDFWTGEQVPVSRSFVARLSERQISRKRTALFSGAFAAGIAAIAVAFATGALGGGSSRPSGGPPTR